MFTLSYNLYKWLKKRNEKSVTIILLGLDNAGKSTLLYALKNEFPKGDVTPTIGFTPSKLVSGKYTIQYFDVGGAKNFRNVWKNYYAEVHGVIYVVDAADTERIAESKETLAKAFGAEGIPGKPILIFANKQDLPGCLSTAELSERMGLLEHKDNRYHVAACQAKTPDGQQIDARIGKGLRWLLDSIDSDYSKLNSRVMHDTEEQKRKEKERKEEQKRRAEASKAARLKEQAEAEAAAAAPPSQGAPPQAAQPNSQPPDDGQEISLVSSAWVDKAAAVAAAAAGGDILAVSGGGTGLLQTSNSAHQPRTNGDRIAAEGNQYSRPPSDIRPHALAPSSERPDDNASGAGNNNVRAPPKLPALDATPPKKKLAALEVEPSVVHNTKIANLKPMPPVQTNLQSPSSSVVSASAATAGSRSSDLLLPNAIESPQMSRVKGSGVSQQQQEVPARKLEA